MSDASLPALALNLALSMGVVIGLMMLAARLLKKAQTYAASSGSSRGGSAGGGRSRARVVRTPIEISTIAPLTRNASVAIVRASGRELVLGVTETQVTLLHSSLETRDLDDDDQPSSTTTQTLPIDTARIAALMPGRTQTADDAGLDAEPGKPAWTDALEMLRARTARR